MTLHVNVSVDALVKTTPGKLYAVILSAASGGAGTVTIRDGHDTSGEIIMKLTATANWTVPVILREPVVFQRGLFIDVGSNVDSVFVQYE